MGLAGWIDVLYRWVLDKAGREDRNSIGRDIAKVPRKGECRRKAIKLLDDTVVPDTHTYSLVPFKEDAGTVLRLP